MILIERDRLRKWPIAHVLPGVPITIHPSVLPVKEYGDCPSRPAATHSESDVSKNSANSKNKEIFSTEDFWLSLGHRGSLEPSDTELSTCKLRQQ